MADIMAYVANDLPLLAKLYTVDQDTTSTKFGQVIPLATGTVTAFMSTSYAPNATTADPALLITAQHVKKETWLLFWDAASLTTVTLASLLTGGYIIIQQPNNVRVYATLAIALQKPAVMG